MDTCASASCKLDSCLKSIQSRCKTQIIGGIKWIRIATNAAILDTIWTTDDPKCPLKRLSSFVMNTPDNNPSDCACSENLFYLLCFDDETGTVDSTWAYSKDDKTSNYNYELGGEFPMGDEDQLCAFENLFTQGKNITALWCENGTEYIWAVGMDGGLCVEEITFTSGATKQDKKVVTLKLAGDVCMNHKRVNAGTVADTEALIDEISADCSTTEDCSCNDDDGSGNRVGEDGKVIVIPPEEQELGMAA